MSAQLKIVTLGGLQVTYGDQPLKGLASRKAEALLVYLACTGKPHARDLLADLLWTDASIDRARGNLSVLLTSLRQQLGPYLTITRQTVAFAPAASAWVDVVELDHSLGAHGTATARALGGSIPTAQWERALALYWGDFLQGFALRDSPGFEAWALGEQERLRRLVLAAGETLVQAYMAEQAYDTGLARAKALLRLDPLHEELHRQIMLLLTYSGERAAALAHYESCRHTLDDELGVEPSAETTLLFERILKGAIAAPTVPTVPAQPQPTPSLGRKGVRGLPFQPTPFIGRERELGEIARLLSDPTCRLLTLLGQGGSGKTRLSIQAATQIGGTLRDGAAFVALAALTGPEQLPAAIAQAVGCALSGHDDPLDQVLAFLRPKQLLLVLDNFEHLLDASSLLNAILATAHDVSVLVTSRERLHVQAEWLLDIDGLRYPSEDELATAIATAAGDLALAMVPWSAITLFHQRAKSIHPQLEATEEALLAVGRICRQVQGLPLGIELAAAWVRMLPPAQIADEIAHNLDLLSTTLRDVPERHRSLRAVFDRSWEMLTTTEQAVLQQLAVFRGSFSADAVALVAQGSPQTLLALVDKSLLHSPRTGWYALHPLLQQYGAAKLAEVPTEWQRVHHAHSGYYADWLEQRRPRLLNRQQTTVLVEMDEQLDNLRLGWETAVAHVLPALDKYDWELLIYYERRGRLHEALHLFAGAVEQLEHALAEHGTDGGSDELQLWYAKVRARHAHFQYCLGHFAVAQATFEEVLSVFKAHGARWECGMAWHMVGSIARQQGAYASAEAATRRSLVSFEQVPDALYAAMCLTILGVLAAEQDRNAEAEQLLRETLATYRAYGEPRSFTFTLNYLGRLLSVDGRLDEATQVLRESLQFNRAYGDPWSVAHSLSHLGAHLTLQGAVEEAQPLLRESVVIFREIGEPGILAQALNQLGYASLDLNDYQAAERCFCEALEAAARSNVLPPVLQSAVGLASLWQKGQPVGHAEQQEIVDLLILVRDHPAGEGPTRQRAKELLLKLQPEGVPELGQPVGEETVEVIVGRLQEVFDQACWSETAVPLPT